MSNVVVPIDDLHVEEYEDASQQLNQAFADAYYLGRRYEARQHIWYFVCGLLIGLVFLLL